MGMRRVQCLFETGAGEALTEAAKVAARTVENFMIALQNVATQKYKKLNPKTRNPRYHGTKPSYTPWGLHIPD